MACEANQFGLARESPRQPQSQVRGLGSRSGEAHLLGRRNHFMDQLRPFDFERMRCAVMRAFGCLRGDRFGYGGMIVTQEKRAVPPDIIDVFVAIYVPLARALSPLDKNRVRLQMPRN